MENVIVYIGTNDILRENPGKMSIKVCRLLLDAQYRDILFWDTPKVW